MKETVKNQSPAKVALVAVAALAAAGTAASMAALPADAAQPQTDPSTRAASTVATDTNVVLVSNVRGEFSASQGTPNSTASIAAALHSAPAALCDGSFDAGDLLADDPLDWTITIGGDVESPYTITVGEAADPTAEPQPMSCTCGGNPADGRATATALTKGVAITELIGAAQPTAGANAITLRAADGSELTLPLAYAIGRHASLVYSLNDEPLSSTVGGSNQLWIAGAPGNAFIRDVVEIEISQLDVLPEIPAPSEDANRPNVGILNASVQ